MPAASSCGALHFSQVADGVEGAATSCRSGAVTAWVLKADLRTARVRATPGRRCSGAGCAQPTSRFACGVQGWLAAINGGLFADGAGQNFHPVGPARGNNVAWTPAGRTLCSAVIGFADNHAAQVHACTGLPSWMTEVVAGYPVLVRNGAPVPPPNPCGGGFCTAGHARTAVGLSADGHTLYLVAVSGNGANINSATAQGLSIAQLSRFFVEIGHAGGAAVHDAINFDGGHSTALVFNAPGGPQILNRRAGSVANHLALVAAHARAFPQAHGAPAPAAFSCPGSHPAPARSAHGSTRRAPAHH